MTDGHPLISRLAAAQLLTSIGDGAVLAVSALYFTTVVGIPAQLVAVGLSTGAAVGLFTTVPFGVLLDRIGAPRALLIASAAAVLGLVVFAFAQHAVAYVVGCVLFACGQGALAAGRQAVVATAVGPQQRVRARALLHTAVNLGLGAGSAAAALLFVLGDGPWGVLVFPADAVLFVIAACLYVRQGIAATASRPRGLPALRDSRYVGLTLLAAVTQLTMPILSVLIPVWVVTRNDGPAWIPAMVLLANTLIVVAIQIPVSRRIRDSRTAGRSLWVAGGSILAACLLFGAAGLNGTGAAMAGLALLAALLLTVAEVTASAGSWYLAFALAADTHQGQYQALFGTSTALSRIIGPVALVPLVLATGALGWTLIGLAMCAASAALVAMTRAHSRQAVALAG